MTLPVAVRELRAAAGARKTFRTRLYIAAGAIVSTIWILYNLLAFSGQPSFQVGQEMFVIQAWSILVLAAMGGVSATADCISQEKRAGTLGLLFLTHLKGRDIVLGKLTAKTIHCFSGLLATLPILTVPMLLGGVQFGESMRVLIVVLDTMFFAASAGLLFSAFTRGQVRAQSWAVVAVIFFIGGLPLGARLLRFYQASPELSLAVEMPSPIFALNLAFGSLAGSQKAYFATSCLIIFGLGFGFLAGASLLTPRCWQDKARESWAERLRARFTGWQLARAHSRSKVGRSLLDRNAFLWLIAQNPGTRTSIWFYLALITGTATFLILYLSQYNDSAAVRIGICVPAAYLLNVGLKVRIGGWSCFRLAEARENGALELILSTPIRLSEFVTGQFLGLRRVFGWPTVAIMGLLLLGMALSLPGIDRLANLFAADVSNSTLYFEAFVFLICGFGFIVLDAIALAWCGMWLGLRCKNVAQARLCTNLLVLVWPLLFYIALIPLLYRIPAIKPFFQHPGFYPVLAFFVSTAILLDLALIQICRCQILKNGRKMVHLSDGSSNDARIWLAISQRIIRGLQKFTQKRVNTSASVPLS